MPKNLGAFVVVRVFYTSSLALSTPMLCQLGSFLVGVVVGGTDLNSLVGSSTPRSIFCCGFSFFLFFLLLLLCLTLCGSSFTLVPTWLSLWWLLARVWWRQAVSLGCILGCFIFIVCFQFLGICRYGFEPPIVYLGPLVGFVFCFKF